MCKKVFICALQIFCVIVYLVENCDAAGAIKQPKRVTNTHGLFPFPRSGRSPWESRGRGQATLVAFPRVGRSGRNPYSNSFIIDKKEKNMNTGVWFGPRLGRVQKRDLYLYDGPVDYPYEFFYPEGQENRPVHYTSRLGRESEEELAEEPQNTI